MAADPFGRFKCKYWQADKHEMTALQYRLYTETPAWFFYGKKVNNVKRLKNG